jgi:hypothetical protein
MTREASIIETIKDNSSFAVNPDDLQISIYPVDPTTYEDPDEWETTVDAGEGGDYMRVRVRYIYNFITPFIKDFFQQGTNVIRAEALYRNEGF